MLRQSLRGFAIAAVAAVALGSPAPAAAVTHVDACTNLTKAGETYILTADISSGPGLACFRVLADRITLDLAGHTITGPGTGGPGTTSAGIWDQNGTRTSTVVKNGSVTNFGIGIVINFSSRSTIRGVTTSDNGIGMLIGPTSLVKDCTVQRNLSFGIVALDGGQVEGCLIGGDEDNGNGQYGLLGGQRMLVTRNTASGNELSGILVGISSTVTHNTANDNGEDGIAVGQKSLVSNNTANDNTQDGIEAVCPSTVTNNKASNNAVNFNLIDFGGGHCFDNGTNKSPDETGCLTGDSGLAAC